MRNINTGVRGAVRKHKEILADVMRWTEQRRRGIIAIDGMCGSGKSFLAREIGEMLGIPVFHMDDYYLPFDRRPEDWLHICAGNMDLQRMESEVLRQLSAGETVHSYRYICREDRREPHDEEPADFAVIEGTYSLHPQLRSYYDLRIFMTVSEREQMIRLREREGSNYRNFLTKWIPMEKLYFQTMYPEEYADIMVKNG